MKKLLGIVVLGLLLSGNAYAQIIEIGKCYTIDGYETWYNDNQESSVEEYNSKRDKFNMVVQPVMSKLYGNMPTDMQGGDGMPDMSNMPDMGNMPTDMGNMSNIDDNTEPTIDEID